MKRNFLTAPIKSPPATARPGITVSELDALRRKARNASLDALRAEVVLAKSDKTTSDLELAEAAQEKADKAFFAYQAAYYSAMSKP